MPGKVLFSAVRNEAPFLLEWIAYHRAIGFDRIVIVSNDSDDGTTELLDALQAAGVIRHLHHAVGADESPQGKAARAVNAAGLIADGDWVIWLDADEFLNIHAGAGMVEDLIAAMGEGLAMLIPWRIFGDGGNARHPGRVISDAFTGAAARDFEGNRIVKTFYRHQEGLTRLSALANHRPQLCDRRQFTPERLLNAAGRGIDMTFRPHRRWRQGIEGKANFSIPEADYVWDLAQINHYMVRTRDMFDLKAGRGRGFVNVVRGEARKVARHTPEFFALNNRNEAEDRTILRHGDRVTAGIDALLAEPAVRAAHEDGLVRTAARVAALAAAPPAPEPPAPTPPVPESVVALEVSMPAAEAEWLRAGYAAHDVILEYGTGGSTRLAAGQPHALIMGVESDRAWAEALEAGIRRDFPQAALRLHWADIGPTGKWGRPRNEAAWRRFHLYAQSVWDQPWFRHPDLVLIDGRFRAGCLLTVLFRITRPVTVLFDDYADRPQTRAAVEGFVQPERLIGRMAQFRLQPTPIPAARLTEIVGLLSEPD